MPVNDWRLLIFNSQWSHKRCSNDSTWYIGDCTSYYLCIFEYGERERTQSMYTFLTFISLSVILYIGRCFSCSSRQCHYKSHVLKGWWYLHTQNHPYCVKLYLCNTMAMSHFCVIFISFHTKSHLAFVRFAFVIFCHVSADAADKFWLGFFYSWINSCLSPLGFFHEFSKFSGCRKPLKRRRKRRPIWQPRRKQLRQRQRGSQRFQPVFSHGKSGLSGYQLAEVQQVVMTCHGLTCCLSALSCDPKMNCCHELRCEWRAID